jgi:hypothetical protein
MGNKIVKESVMLKEKLVYLNVERVGRMNEY